MAMNLPAGGAGRDPEVVVDINTTPLIDVMLVLLIMLIITIPIQTHDVKLDMPAASPPPPGQPPPVVNLEIDFDGTLLWDGTVLSSRAELERRLGEAAHTVPQPEFHVRPNKLVEYKYVAAVLAAAQRLGVSQIGLVGNEQFMQ